MKITVLSDLHFGYASFTERDEDTFEAVREALERAGDSDIIVLGGDIFDTKTPSNETLVKAMELLIKPLSDSSSVTLSGGIGKDLSDIQPMALSGTPVVAIHGTHERRARGLLNPVQLLEKAGFIVYLDRNGVVFEKKGEKVCIQGLSGVPDKHTEETLKEWNPKPVPGCLNIFMIHQNLTEFMHEKVQHTLDVAKLPKGFDFYICGHIHETIKKKHGDGVILLPGSLIPTQLTTDFTETGFWQIDTITKGVTFTSLEKHRKAYVREIDTCNGIEGIEKEITSILKEKHEKKPLIRIKLKGKNTDLPLKQIEVSHSDSAIVSFKKDFEKDDLPEARSIEEHRLSVQELGRKIMKDNLQRVGLDENLFESIFELLLEKKGEDALRLLSKPVNSSLTEKDRRTEEKTEAKPESDTKSDSWKGFLKGA